MYLKYGDYQHDAGEASVVISKQQLFSRAGIAIGVRERWTIRGQLHAADQAALTLAIDELAAAYAVPGQDVGFYLDSGEPTSHTIDSASTNGGVRVVVPPSFPEGRGAEYSTFRSYTIVLEAEWLDDAASLVSWHEVLHFAGGGPRFGYLELLAGSPVKQVLQEQTTFRATQSGEAIGCFAYPLPPDPLWPTAEHIDRRQLQYDLPQRQGPLGAPTFTHFRVTWKYEFESHEALVGTPTAWPG